MRRGRKPKPTISIETIKSCLKMLETGQEDKAVHLLENLALVEQFLHSPAIPDAEDVQVWAVRKIITDLIIQHYNEMRALYNQEAVTSQETYEQVIEALEHDFTDKSKKYIDFGILYYRYVRTDLNIFKQEDLSDAIHASVRQLRRHHNNGINRLREALIYEEWRVRKQQHKLVLKREISALETILIERLPNVVADSLREEPFQPIVITGADGVGKTSYAKQIAHHLIEDEADEFKLDYVLWLNEISNPEQVSNELQDLIYDRNTQAKWYDVLPVRNLLLVIDQITMKQEDIDSWVNLFQHLHYARVIICNTSLLPTFTMFHHIHLKDLSADGADKLISQLDITKTLSHNDKRKIVQQVGTNPRLLHKAVRSYISEQLSAKELLTNNFGHIYSNVDAQNRLLWLACAVNETHGIDHNIQHHLVEHPHKKLIDNSLITYRQGRALISLSANRYIINQYQVDRALQDRFHDFLLYSIGKSHDEFLIDACRCNWVMLPSKNVYDILLTIDLNTLSADYIKYWLEIVDVRLHHARSYHLEHAYGTALRCINQYSDAINYLQNAMMKSGKKGDFETQAWSRYEMAVIAQAQNQFERAMNMYSHIIRLSKSSTLTQKVNLQMARIMIEKGDANKALEYLDGNNTVRATILKCEAYFLLKDYRRTQNLLLHSLENEELTSDLKISTYTILGRVAQNTKSFENSITYFNEALTVADNHGNWVDIARARSNFANGHLSSGNKLSIELIVELESLLHEAEEIQKRTQDIIGLEATRRNIRQIKALYSQTP